MAHTVVIVGAGGKMGHRAVEKLAGNPEYRVLVCEKDTERARTLEEKGFKVSPLEAALGGADFVVMAVPDALIGRLAQELVPQMEKDSTLIMLDAAAAYVGELPVRDDVTYMITHPCHPPMFTEQATPEARRDYFGGVALQDIIVSLAQGSESNFVKGVELCKAIFGPVRTAYRVTPEQFALLEPAMAEIVVASAAALMKQALEAAVEAGVPRDAAEAFMAGHAQIALAIVFGAEKSPFSDAAQVAIRWGSARIFTPDWKNVFQAEELRAAIQVMIHPEV
jgi:NAD(P)-dependent dehydrogenase (short-subunit alcohol dehydrogenase family)